MILLTLLLLVAILPAAGFLWLPWKLAVAHRLQAALERQGLHHVTLTVSSVGWHSATIKDISIGGSAPLTLKTLDIHYQPQELRKGILRDLGINGLKLALHHGAQGWIVSGIDSDANSATPAAPFAIPVDADDLSRFPASHLKITDSSLAVSADGWQFDMPLDLSFQKSPAKLDHSADHLVFHTASAEIDTGKTTLSLALDEKEKRWTGPWNVQSIDVKNNSAVPMMDGGGTISATATQINVKGALHNKDNSIRAAFMLEENLAEPAQSVLTVGSALMPWAQGTLSIHNVRIPLSGSKPIDMVVQISRLSVDTLMQTLTGKHVTATGTISGSVPLRIGRDGSIGLSSGGLKAEGPGRIALPPDILPGNNAQIAMVRSLLQDLHYSNLQIDLAGGDGHKSMIGMTIEGNNPAVYNGRPVKLNVHLGGDVLDLLRQNIMLLTDPKQMLKQDKK